MKSGLAVTLELGETLPPGRRPTLLLYEREEGPYAENGLGKLFDAGLVPAAALAICLEPTDGMLQLGCLGSSTPRCASPARARTAPGPGRAGTPSMPAPRCSPASRPSRAARGVARRPRLSRGGPGDTRAAAARARNVVPDASSSTSTTASRRPPLEEAQADVRQLARGADQIVFTDLSPSGPTCRANRHVQRLLALRARRRRRSRPGRTWRASGRTASTRSTSARASPRRPTRSTSGAPSPRWPRPMRCSGGYSPPC